TVFAFADHERRLSGASSLAKQLLAVKDHGVPDHHRAESSRVGIYLLDGGVDERAIHAQIARRQILVALDLDGREREERVVPIPGGTEDRLGEVLLEAPAVLLELREVRGRERHDVRIRHEGLT